MTEMDEHTTDPTPATQQRLSREQVGGWPRGLVLATAVGALLIAGMLLAVRAIGGTEPALSGTVLDGRPAPDFTLTDHRGQRVRLSDFRGKAVVLTFIYTNCPDVCPLTVENLRVADELLPAEVRDGVALLAVTLDPARDTEQALQTFTAVHRLTDNPRWFALRGDDTALSQVWRDYGIYPGTSAAPPAGTDAPMAGGGAGHTDGIYFIDPEGRERVFIRSTATPQEIAANLRALLN